VGALALGYAGLVHPLFQALALLVVVVLAGLWWFVPWTRLRFGRVLRTGVVVVVAYGVLVGGVILKNRLSFGFGGLTPFTGYALSTKTVRVVERLPDKYAPVRAVLVAARDADLTKPGSSHTALSYIWRAKDEIGRVTGLEGPELSRYLVGLNLELIRMAPLVYLQEVVATGAAFWSPTSGQGLASMGSGVLHALWALLDLLLVAVFAGQLLVVVGMGVVVWAGGRLPAGPAGWRLGAGQVRIRVVAYWVCVGAVFYTMLICSLFGPGLTRYRAPVMPLVVFLCCLGVDTCWRLVRRRLVRLRRGRLVNNQCPG